jgi:hypothetical protein
MMKWMAAVLLDTVSALGDDGVHDYGRPMATVVLGHSMEKEVSDGERKRGDRAARGVTGVDIILSVASVAGRW